MEISRQALFGRLNPSLFKAIESATAFCKLRGNPYVELVHWLHQLLRASDGDLQRVLRHAEVDLQALEADLARALASLPTGASSISDFSFQIEAAVERAWVYATLAFADDRVRGAYLLTALLKTTELRRTVLSISSQFAKVRADDLVDSIPGLIAQSPESQEAAYDGSGLASAIPGEASGAVSPTGTGKSALAQYCRDLTEAAREGQLDPVIGREHEIRTMTDILLRRRQNNPLLTGEAGVGKTAVIEGLAQAIAVGDIPPSLKDVRLLSLDVGALLAGASMKGEFEARLKGVLEEAAKSAKPVILFVDEVHTLVGAGGQAGTGDAANLLKPALARGALRTIGATTWSEYKRHIEKDPALTRRFQVLQVLEPQEASAVAMVRGLVDTFETHHKVLILDEAVRAAVKLSHRYIPSRQLPDKAISLLDTACARVALTLHAPPAAVELARQRLAAAQADSALLAKEAAFGKEDRRRIAEIDSAICEITTELAQAEARWQQERALATSILEQRQAIEAAAEETSQSPAALIDLEAELQSVQGETPLVYTEVGEAVVAAIVADWTGIPVTRMVADEVATVMALPQTLGARIIGQDHALAQLGERIQTARAQLTDPNKPVGVFLLVGPSGVGKTETALALADALYGGEQNLITINLSEFQESHTVSTLKGAPPGYVGYGEGGVLTEAVRRRPYSVVLLDEVEKAHPDVHEVFYQVFDKGYMEDGEGRHIDFKNTILLLTSNAGSDLLTSLCDDLALLPEPAALRDALMPELRKTFPAAFLGRLVVVPYLPLAADNLGRIVHRHLDRVVKRMREQHDIALTYDDAVVTHIVERCPVGETGARQLIGLIEQVIQPQLAKLWLGALADKRPLAAIEIRMADDASTLIYHPEYLTGRSAGPAIPTAEPV
ncbi:MULTISPECIES: type VI secretion system ATPase TssH [Ralstonia]|uniref:Protein ClpV1 n=2 Tax=Ralstonia pickettii TaxID=329 RepID=A0ABM9IM89_RALPI|nr:MULTISPECIES: type VI secretion system ATPase TssH [Ralstonia]MBA4199124.1 type VI secretion system ATPase TssH [Ralstonia sp.]MBA4230169.1 type VI secretion system ATPase TssH [Ralstonia sp.]MBA4234976.1 type VI secretion system ATPase TssH [Ralstonia sp.]MBA4277953.1 type VI secretion system ATPase TssH [Ralstonia sp.]MBA4400413.1 type VI secretion system ATPase TssH [Ralstonia sp.]